MSETKGRCRQRLEEAYSGNKNFVPPYAWITADAIDRLAEDVASIKAKVDAVAPDDVKHFVESEKAWVTLVTEQRDEATCKLSVARAEVERLRAELAARPADGNSPKTSDSPPAAPPPAAQAAGWLTQEERQILANLLLYQWGNLGWPARVVPALNAILARAGSPPVVEVPAMPYRQPNFYSRQEAECYRAALDKAGVAWKEVPRE